MLKYVQENCPPSIAAFITAIGLLHIDAIYRSPLCTPVIL